MKDSNIWIFGYGSLCWHPGFQYEEMLPGHIKGYSRVFWQGNKVQRGTPQVPGRVATLTPSDNSKTSGCAFRIRESEAQEILDYLYDREVRLGSYVIRKVSFYPKNSPNQRINALVYIALPGNEDWLGPATLEEIAKEVLAARGSSGLNVEYFQQLAQFLRNYELEDQELFYLDKTLKKLQEKQKILV